MSFTSVYGRKNPRETDIYEEIIKNISNEAQVGSYFIKDCLDTAFSDWEKESKRDVITIYLLSWEDRSNEAKKILDKFVENVGPVFNSEQRLQRSIDIASDGLKTIFKI